MKIKMVTEEFLKKDIKWKIDEEMYSKQYMRGYIFACYLLEAITTETHNELKSYLFKEEEKVNE